MCYSCDFSVSCIIQKWKPYSLWQIVEEPIKSKIAWWNHSKKNCTKKNNTQKIHKQYTNNTTNLKEVVVKGNVDNKLNQDLVLFAQFLLIARLISFHIFIFLHIGFQSLFTSYFIFATHCTSTEKKNAANHSFFLASVVGSPFAAFENKTQKNITKSFFNPIKLNFSESKKNFWKYQKISHKIKLRVLICRGCLEN